MGQFIISARGAVYLIANALEVERQQSRRGAWKKMAVHGTAGLASAIASA
jgi:hypothetical protein